MSRNNLPVFADRESLIEYVWSCWRDWFCEPTPSVLDVVIMAGGPAHRERLLAFFLSGRRPRPRVFAKVAWSNRESTFIEHEHEMLTLAQRSLPDTQFDRAPRPLSRTKEHDTVAVFTEALEGRRVPDPSFRHNYRLAWRRYDRFLAQSLEWSKELARSALGNPIQPAHVLNGSTLAEWVQAGSSGCRHDGRDEGTIRDFAAAVQGLSISVTTGWQHGDLAMSNAVDGRGQYRFLDWEHADPTREPWFDLASAPMALLAMASRQHNLAPEDLALMVFGSDHIAARFLRDRMEAYWSFPLPLSWGVVITCFHRASLRVAGGRKPGWSSRLGCILLTDERIRREASWLAPTW